MLHKYFSFILVFNLESYCTFDHVNIVDINLLQETMNVIEKASGGRVTAATAMNLTSSRLAC